MPIRPFNRTIVELKLIFDVSHCALGYTFNRTIVELKQILERDFSEFRGAFNRTIVELKLNGGES